MSLKVDMFLYDHTRIFKYAAIAVVKVGQIDIHVNSQKALERLIGTLTELRADFRPIKTAAEVKP